jgi:hypothetical protein
MSKLNKVCIVMAVSTFLTIGSLPYVCDYLFGTNLVTQLNQPK